MTSTVRPLPVDGMSDLVEVIIRICYEWENKITRDIYKDDYFKRKKQGATRKMV